MLRRTVPQIVRTPSRVTLQRMRSDLKGALRILCVTGAVLVSSACAAGESQPTAQTVDGEPAESATVFLPPEAPPLETAVSGESPGEPAAGPRLEEFPVPSGSHPHDVAPAPDGTVWYTAQRAGALGRLDPLTGDSHQIPLGSGSAPHGVIVGPDGNAWVTDGGMNAIVRVEAGTEAVTVYPLPEGTANANLNTAVFDLEGTLWFTGQNGIFGNLDPATGQVSVYPAPRGRGPYGIAITPPGEIYYASLAGSYLGRIDRSAGNATILEPPTPGQGARRVWSDSSGVLWVSEWNAGKLARYDPHNDSWAEWDLPGNRPMPYAVYVDSQDQIWISDFGSNALLRFDPQTEQFEIYPLPSPNAGVRQILGRPGEIWGAESGTDKLVVIRTD